MDFTLQGPKTDEEFEAYYRLRYERLRAEHGQPPGSEKGDMEEFSSHLIAKVGDKVVGAECWILLPSRDGLRTRNRQMAVDPDYEGHGIASALTGHMEEQSRLAGSTQVFGNARTEMVHFFERRGYYVVGPGVRLFGEVESFAMALDLV